MAAEHTVEFSVFSKMWVVRDRLGRIISHHASEGGAKSAAAKEGVKSGRRTQESPYKPGGKPADR